MSDEIPNDIEKEKNVESTRLQLSGLDFNQLEEILMRSNYFERLVDNLLSVVQPCFFCVDMVVKILLHGPDGSGKRLLARYAAKRMRMNFFEEQVSDLFDENIVGTEKRIRNALSKCINSAPCMIYLSGYQLFTQLEDQDLDRIEHCISELIDEIVPKQPIIFISATSNHDAIYKSSLSHMFQRDIEITPMNLNQAEEFLRLLQSELGIEVDATQMLRNIPCSDYFLGNLISLISGEEFYCRTSDPRTASMNDFGSNLDTRWDDIGGLSEVRKEIIDAIQLSMDYPQLKESGLRRTGILLYGPPGTGKTLLAKAVATECNLNFINVKGPELLNEFVGQSEHNVRELFKRAREQSPSIIFFDEIDSLAPNRGQAGDSGGVMDRTVSQILAEMDGVGKSEDVFVIGATNRVDLVDSSLMRPGRFDKILEVPLPKGRTNRLQILKALTRKMKLSDDVDLEVVESSVPRDISGADFRGLCSRALHKAFDKSIGSLEAGLITEDDVEVIITMADFKSAIDSF